MENGDDVDADAENPPSYVWQLRQTERANPRLERSGKTAMQGSFAPRNESVCALNELWREQVEQSCAH